MNILSFTGAVLFMCILIITVRQMKPEFSLLLSIACGAVLKKTLYVHPDEELARRLSHKSEK